MEFHKHLMDLYNNIDPKLIELYDSDVFRQTCIINNRLIGFVNILYIYIIYYILINHFFYNYIIIIIYLFIYLFINKWINK